MSPASLHMDVRFLARPIGKHTSHFLPFSISAFVAGDFTTSG
jgi:hypothetical protein